MKLRFLSLLLVIAASAAAQVEVTSLLGRPLHALPDSDGTIHMAQQKVDLEPRNPSLLLALSKAYAARRQYREAVDLCSRAIAMHPKNADLYLEKGHRELGLREFDAARQDLSKAVKLNPELLEAHYHLGLAYYFLQRFDKAAGAFENALNLAKTADNLIDCDNWSYVSLRRAGQPEAAAQVLAKITPDVKNTEPHLFFYLQLLHFYQGKLSADEVLPHKPAGPEDLEGELAFNTINYGVGNWLLYNNHDTAKAREHFQAVVAGSAWNSWGFIGSEIQLARHE